MEYAYNILKEHKKNDFQDFYNLGFKAESMYGCCAQCLTIPFIELLAADKSLFQYAGGFCAGYGMVGTYPCGALSGGIMTIAHFFGRSFYDLSGDLEASKQIFRDSSVVVRKFEAKFKKEIGHTLCDKVQNIIFGRSFDFVNRTAIDYPKFVELGAYQDKCTTVVGKASRITAQVIFEEFEEKSKKGIRPSSLRME